MPHKHPSRKLAQTIALTSLALICFGANAAPIYWTDWTANPTTGSQGQGTITTPTSTVQVTYSNAQGIGFYQPSGGIDYWQNQGGGRNDLVSPYTSTLVDNSPTGSDIVALSFAGTQTLYFSQQIANPVFAYVSLNGNGYAFDQDFDILSVGGVDGNACGYWGCGTSFKNIVTLSNGDIEYQLLGTGEPHGALRFTGAFDQVSWRSMSSEYWNGFTVGVQGTAAEVFHGAVPEPGTLALLGLGLAGFAVSRRKKNA